MNTPPRPVGFGDHLNSPTNVETPANRLDDPATSGRAGLPPGRPAVLSTRDYFYTGLAAPAATARAAWMGSSLANLWPAGPTLAETVERIAADTTGDTDWCNATGLERPLRRLTVVR